MPVFPCVRVFCTMVVTVGGCELEGEGNTKSFGVGWGVMQTNQKYNTDIAYHTFVDFYLERNLSRELPDDSIKIKFCLSDDIVSKLISLANIE